jgi:hypothetical protein
MSGLLKTALSGIAMVLFALIFAAAPFIAQTAASPDAPLPRVSFGLGATVGYEDVQITGSNDMIWDSGTVLGAGFIVEYMWNQRFGLHSGAWAMLFQNDSFSATAVRMFGDVAHGDDPLYSSRRFAAEVRLRFSHRVYVQLRAEQHVQGGG